MRMIRPCGGCAAPLTIKMDRCPHCQQRNPRALLARATSLFASLVGGLAISSTLSACYGSPCADESDDSCFPKRVPMCTEISSNPVADDKDKDGYCRQQDCDEMDPQVNIVAFDVPGDGIDQNCDGRDATR